jgi:hypothetical protein
MTKFVIFLHVYSSIGLFAAMALEYRKLVAVKQSSGIVTNAKRALTSHGEGKFAMIFMLTALLSGIHLMINYGGPAPWMTMAMVSLGLLITVGLLYSQRVKFAMRKLSEQEHKSPANVMEITVSRSLSSIKLRIAIASGIIALMTIKPFDFVSAVLIELFFCCVGVIWVLQKKF